MAILDEWLVASILGGSEQSRCVISYSFGELVANHKNGTKKINKNINVLEFSRKYHVLRE